MFPLLLSFVAILALMTFGFNAVIERRNNPNQAIASGPQGPQRVVLARNGNRQYVVPGLINAQQVTFLIDTGADSVAIPAATAERLGLERGMAIQALTAVGPTVAYSARHELPAPPRLPEEGRRADSGGWLVGLLVAHIIGAAFDAGANWLMAGLKPGFRQAAPGWIPIPVMAPAAPPG